MADTKKTVSLIEIVNAISLRQSIVNIDSLQDEAAKTSKRVKQLATTDIATADTATTDTPTTAINLTGLNSLIEANQTELSFLSDMAYQSALVDTNAGVVIVSPECSDAVPATAIPIIVKSPYLAYASASVLFDSTNKNQQKQNPYLHPTAQVADDAILGANVTIGAYCVVGEHTKIGEGTHIDAKTVIGDDVEIGKHCVINAHVNIAHGCQIGDAVRIHAHASIGSEGFGFAPTQDPANLGWQRIAQLGRVIIGNNVRIGSQTCIDRGAIGDTVIEDNVIIDNLVQIAHNVRIGAGTAIAANTGIAGSTTIGKRCIIGGAVGIVGHIHIADDTTLTGMTMVTKSIKKSGSYSSGTVAMPTIDWRRAAIRFRNMGKKKDQIKK